MNIKNKFAVSYILLGIGFAFVVFGFIIYITPTKYRDYSDDEIISKAKDLGMQFLKESIKEEPISDTEEKNEKKSNDNKQNEHENIEVIFVIKKGQSSRSIINNLYEKEIIYNIDEFVEYVKVNNKDKKFQYGEYKLSKNMKYDVLVDIITIK